MEWWHWLLAGAVLAGGIIWWWSSKTKTSSNPDQRHLRQIEEYEDLLRSYQASALDYTAQIERLKARLDALKKSYAEEGLSAEEVAERFRSLKGDP